ncbi:MAG TPA: hypothetical protein VJ602_05655 [Paludibacter sp.]|nr:hypothetical protein [Paludibacter sp.]
MKTKVASLLVVLVLITTQCMAQKRVTIEAQNDDISNNLDLKAVSTVFGESRNLEDFEQRLNDYDSGISNLDLNNDGQVDYLRVIEKNENNIHLIVIQAVLDKDVYQDVASIVVERDRDSNTTVQVIGDPYLYGDNYIIEPAYVYTPSIFSFFWGSAYFSWHSPYYWGYYPNYYHHRRPYELNIYMSNVYSHVNHNQRYYYTSNRRDDRALVLHNSIRRNDYAVRYPDRTFSSRNVNVRNKREFEFSRSGVVRSNQSRVYQGNSTGDRNIRSYDNNVQRNSQSNRDNSNWNQRNSVQRNYTPSNDNRNSTYQNRSNNNNWQNTGSSRSQDNSNSQIYSPQRRESSPNTNSNIQRNSTYQPRQNTDNGSRNSVTRENTRSNTQVSQPRNEVQRSSDNNNNRGRESRSENKESGRR